MAVGTHRDTRTAILDAAEILMAEHGINGVSLRAIVSEAGANSAALHYHFDSRDGLVKAILARKGRRPSLRRREILDSLVARADAPDVHDLVDAIVDPMVEMLLDEGESGRRFFRFIARLQSDRSEVHLAEEDLYFHDVHERMAGLAAKACPHLSKKERARRFTMLRDAMLQSLANAEVMTQEWNDSAHEEELGEFTTSLKNFLAGGLAAAAD